MNNSKNTLIGFPIDDKSYQVDLEIQDRYTNYSAEILRLALLGIAGYGFLLKDVVMAHEKTLGPRIFNIWPILMIGAVSFGLAATLALQHRVCATDCISNIAAFIRKKESGRIQEADINRSHLIKALKLAAFLLQSSAILLALGAICAVITFCYMLWPIAPLT